MPSRGPRQAGSSTFGALSDTPTTRALKTIDESSPANSTLQDDDELLLAGLVAGTYLIEGTLFYSRTSGATSLLKIGWTVSDASGTFEWSTGAPSGGDAALSSKTATLNAQTSVGAASGCAIYGRLILTISGSLQMRFALSTGTDALVVRKGSSLRATRIA